MKRIVGNRPYSACAIGRLRFRKLLPLSQVLQWASFALHLIRAALSGPREFSGARIKAGLRGSRRGLTLLEVLLSLGLFLGALAALSQLWYGGVRASVQARLATQAILRCESKLNEVVAGAIPLQDVTDTPFEDDSTWNWNLQVRPGPHLNVSLVVVNVSHPGQGGMSASGHQLSRLIRDPQVWIDAQQITTDGTTTP